MSLLYPAPVCLFVYKRVASLQQTIRSLLLNDLAAKTDLYIFSDAPRSAADDDKVQAVRDFVDTIRGFKSVTVYAEGRNKGLAKSIIEGVSSIISKKGHAIVLEDDLVVADNFLQYMNSALAAYQSSSDVFSISGYTSPVVCKEDVYFTKRASSWGWATWENRWEKVDWNVGDYDRFINDHQERRRFNAMGSDLTNMLKKQMNGMINSWAIRWVYHQFRQDLFTVFPAVSKVKNIGFSVDSSNTEKHNESRFATQLDVSGNKDFYFPKRAVINHQLIRQFVQPYTIQTRVIYKIKSMLNI